MARNKYPEETVNLIVDVSAKLFIEKGYDQTSIQDIIDHLGGLSKGAIYHHFKSKEEILIAVFDKIGSSVEPEMAKIRDDKSLNGMQKLKKMFASSLEEPDQMQMMAACPRLLDNPKLLSVHIASTIYDSIPNYVEPVVMEGVADGSIQTDYPNELAQFIIWMSNLWLNPLVYKMTDEELTKKIAFFTQLMDSMGIPVMDNALQDRIQKMHSLIKK